MADDDGVIVEAENCVWYKLNVDTGTATISHEEPIEGDWGSLKRVTKSKLILYNRNESDTAAKRIFSCTSYVSNDYILKPLMVTWNKNKKLWIIFYPSFTEFQCWWESKLGARSKSVSKVAELQFWLVKFARRILKALMQAHAQGVAHGNLSDWSDYAIVGERLDEKLMLTNLSVRRDQETDEEWKIKCVADLREFVTKLHSFIPEYRKDDGEIIIEYLKILECPIKHHTSEGIIKNIISFPYWKKPYKRMKVFFDADKALKLEPNLIVDIDIEVKERGAFNLPWDAKFKEIPSREDSEVMKQLKKVYYKGGKGSYDGMAFESLIEYLRDVYVHATNTGIYEEFDGYLNWKYPGFASIAHQCCFG